MVERFSDATRHEIVRRMIVHSDVEKVAAAVGVSETTVRNVWNEYANGAFPQYQEFLPHVEVIRRMDSELQALGISVGQAAIGLDVYRALLELKIEPTELQRILRMLKEVAGGTILAEFGKAVQELARVMADTGLSFNQVESLVVTKKSELETLQSKLRSIAEEITSNEAKKTESRESLELTLKQNGLTTQYLGQIVADKRALSKSGISLDNINTLADFIRLSRAGGFLEAAKELMRLESETGMSFGTLIKEYERTKTAIENGHEEEKRLNNVIPELKSKVADIKHEEIEQLENKGITKEKLDRYVELIDRLRKGGIDLD
jgi:multidrug efflux pump subunit AcrA (membrane-fusion protein)